MMDADFVSVLETVVEGVTVAADVEQGVEECQT